MDVVVRVKWVPSPCSKVYDHRAFQYGPYLNQNKLYAYSKVAIRGLLVFFPNQNKIYAPQLW